MFRPRVIPVLLLKNKGLVKSIRFRDHKYIGDPINAVKIFNDLRADELVFLDIDATKENRTISLDLVKQIGDEARMPFAIGGGIRTLEHIKKILKAGAEKVVLNTIVNEDLSFVRKAAETFGQSTIVVCLDFKKDFWGKLRIVFKNGKKVNSTNPFEFVEKVAEAGAGEMILQSVDKDGTLSGYDIDLLKISNLITIPVVALGGAKSLHDFKYAVEETQISAVAAGSIFVYHGPRQAVLINYPTRNELQELF